MAAAVATTAAGTTADPFKQGRAASPPPAKNSIAFRPKLLKTDSTLSYRGKTVDGNSLRLLTIEPAANKDDPIVCTLSEVRFGAKPKFNALSYTWGDSSADDPEITLNGFPFAVRHNLFDALKFIRGHKAYGAQKFWIDAVCINQADIDERNRQVRIMDQIYFRAANVVIWLGQRYAKYETPEAPGGDDDDAIKKARDQKRELCSQLNTDPYWGRVWILQEINKAWSLHVNFGTTSMTWNGFLDFLREHTDDTQNNNQNYNARNFALNGNRKRNNIRLSTPQSLHRTLRAKEHRGSHRLIDLLRDHEHAKCSDLHDKVYGLLGMVSDAGSLPIDYKKPLYDVWTDTLALLNEKQLLDRNEDFISAGLLVKRSLQLKASDIQCPPILPVSSPSSPSSPFSSSSPPTPSSSSPPERGNSYAEQIDPSHLVDITDDTQDVLDRLAQGPKMHPGAYYHHAIVLGSVLRVGPTIQSIVDEPDVLSAWKSAISDLYARDELEEAHWESDNLMRVLLSSDEEGEDDDDSDNDKIARGCIRVPSTVLFAPQTFPMNARDAVGIDTDAEPIGPGSPETPRCYYLKAVSGRTRNKIGIAAGVVRPGDLICETSGRRLVVRVFREGPLKGRAAVVGAARTTEDICRNNGHDYRPTVGRVIDRYADIYLGVEALFALAEDMGIPGEDEEEDEDEDDYSTRLGF